MIFMHLFDVSNVSAHKIAAFANAINERTNDSVEMILHPATQTLAVAYGDVWEDDVEEIICAILYPPAEVIASTHVQLRTCDCYLYN